MKEIVRLYEEYGRQSLKNEEYIKTNMTINQIEEGVHLMLWENHSIHYQ